MKMTMNNFISCLYAIVSSGFDF